MTAKHTLSVLVENKPGVLARVAQLFSRRGFNIDSLAVGETEHPEVSRITIVVNADESPLEQVTKQLNKLVNVLKIVELDPVTSVQRELAAGEGPGRPGGAQSGAGDGEPVPRPGGGRRPGHPDHRGDRYR